MIGGPGLQDRPPVPAAHVTGSLQEAAAALAACAFGVPE